MLKAKRIGIAAALTILVFLSGCSQNQTKKTQTSTAYTEPKTPTHATESKEVDRITGIVMKQTPESTCFSQIGYDPLRSKLYVTFRDSGKYYRYDDVPRSTWTYLSTATSKGGYYNSHIKGNYDCEKLN